MSMLFGKKKNPAKAAQPTPQKETEPAAEAAGETAGSESSEEQTPIHQVVSEHGPANKIEMQHDHEGGQHHTTSHHGKHKHHATHGSAGEAHDHARAAAGADGGGEQQDSMGMGGQDSAQANIPGY